MVVGFHVAGPVDFGELGEQLVEQREVAEHVDEGELLQLIRDLSRQDHLSDQVDAQGHHGHQENFGENDLPVSPSRILEQHSVHSDAEKEVGHDDEGSGEEVGVIDLGCVEGIHHADQPHQRNHPAGQEVVDEDEQFEQLALTLCIEADDGNECRESNPKGHSEGYPDDVEVG